MSIDAIDAQLKNWARWAHDKAAPDLSIPEPPIFESWRPTGDARDSGWGDEVPGDRILDAIDWTAAEALDKVLLHLRVKDWYIIRRHYYSGRTQPEIELQASLRALLDLLALDSRNTTWFNRSRGDFP